VKQYAASEAGTDSESITMDDENSVAVDDSINEALRELDNLVRNS